MSLDSVSRDELLDGSSDDSSRLPIDPRQVGPRESIRLGYRRMVEHRITVALIAAAAVALVWLLDPSIPSVPRWAWVAMPVIGIGGFAGYRLGKRLTEYLWSPDVIRLRELQPKSGNTQFIDISPERWQRAEFVDLNGNPTSRRNATEVLVNGTRVFDVERYYPSRDLVVVAWLGGEDNATLRSWEHAVDEVKSRVEREANKALEMRAGHGEEVREDVREVSNTLIRKFEGVQHPDGESMAKRLAEGDSDHETVESLLDDIEDQFGVEPSVSEDDLDDDLDADPDEQDESQRTIDDIRQQAAMIVRPDGETAHSNGEGKQ